MPEEEIVDMRDMPPLEQKDVDVGAAIFQIQDFRQRNRRRTDNIA